MEYTKVDSSMIDLIGYDVDSEVLEARFVNTGHTYIYEDIPKKVYKELINASSKGSYMREIIEIYDGYRLRGQRPNYPKKNPMDKYVGKFMIFDMPDFDKEYLTMECEPYLEINQDGTGEFQFGLVKGHFSGKIKEQSDDEVFRFKWTGNDENDEASGTGYLLLNDREDAEGEIVFNDGDEHYFFATKEEKN